MVVKNKIKKVVLKAKKIKIKSVLQDLMKKILVSFLITTNVFFYIPTVTFAADSEDEKTPATVPAAANEIISKYVSTKSNGISGTSNGNSIISTYEGKGDGWDSITKVDYPNGTERTYRNYKQFPGIGQNTYYDEKFWNGNIRTDGCGPTAVAIVLSGYGYDYDPGDVVTTMKNAQKNIGSFENLQYALKELGNIEAEICKNKNVEEMRKNLSEGRPIIANMPQHYVTYLGEDENGNLIISDPGKNDSVKYRYGKTLEEVASQITLGYIQVKSDGNATSSDVTDSSEEEKEDKKDKKEDKKETKSEDKDGSAPEGTGEAKIEKTNLKSTGYEFIFTSGTTGRQFKEYRQDISGWDSKYNIAQVGQSWTSECGIVSCMIAGSGYTNQANFENATDILVNEQGGRTYLPPYLKRWTDQNASTVSFDDSELTTKLHEGCVAVVHNDWSSSPHGHWVAILDYDKNKDQVYVSNPWSTDSRSGWMSISDASSGADKLFYITNDGSAVDYGGTGSTTVSGEISNIDMSGNITKNNRNGYKINIDLDKEIEGMLETLKEKDFKLEKYLEESFQKEHLKNYIKAAIVTQYPDLRSAEEIASDAEITDPTEVQGCIKVKRYTDGETEAFAGNSLSNPVDSEDNGMYLSYIPYSEFSKFISNDDASAINYFSLDSSNNIVVAGWETLDVNVTIEQIEGDPDPNPDPAPEPRKEEYSKLIEKKVNYINQVSNYTMPFSLLWSLLVYGNDETFVNDLAKLVIDTEIVIGCYDATNVKNSTYTNTYVKKYTINRTAGIGEYVATDGGYQAEAESIEEKTCTYKVTEKHTLKTDSPSLKVKYANTWTAIYNNEYKANKEEENPTEDSTTLPDQNVDTTYDYKYNEETEDIINNDELLQKNVDAQIEALSKSTSEYNHQKFAYRYNILTKALNEDYNYTKNSDDSYKLLHDEDVQNYLINMIIDENSQEYILDTFINNETIKRRAKKINETNYLDIQKGAGKCAQGIVSELESNGLRNKLTEDNSNTAKNKTYSSNVTSIATKENITKVDQKEKIETNTTKTDVEKVTTGTNNNVKMKDNINSDENSFVKLLYYSKRAKSNLDIIDSWFFESMEETAAIADMVDLIKYLFNVVYKGNTEYTKEEIQELLSLFEPGTMTQVSRTQLTGNSVKEQVWNYLKAEGFTDEAAAGVMGNMEAESGVDPTNIQGGGAGPAAGICQWENYNTKSGRWKSMSDFAKNRGKDWTDLQSQLDYLMKELPSTFDTYTGLSPHYYDTGEWCWWEDEMPFEEFKTITDVDEATEIFCRVYERPSITHMDRRLNAAQSYYELYKGQ